MALTALLRKRVWLRGLLMACVAIAAIALQWTQPAWRVLWELEFLVKDRLTLWNASDQAEDRLVVIDIDEASLSSIGPWPWKRSVLADLVENLVSDYGVRGVGLDIVFPAPADALGDARLAALAQAAPLTLAQAFDFVQRNVILQTGVPVFRSWVGTKLSNDAVVPQASGYIANHPGLKDARCVGNIGIQPDPDGQVRSVPLLAQWQQATSPLLPLAMLQCGSNHPVDVSTLSSRLFSQPFWEVPFPRNWQAYTVVPAQDVLGHRVDPQWLRERWVLVGSSALGLSDRATTPLGESVAGVMVHAAVLTALLDQVENPPGARWEPLGKAIASAWILLSLGVMGWVMGRWRAWMLIPLTLVGTAGWITVAAWLMRQQLGVHVISPILAHGVLFFMVPLEWWLTQRDQGRLLRTFANYVAPPVLRQMLRQGIEQPLVPRYCEITVLSADMQNYSGLTVQGSLEDAAQLTREFLHCLTDPLLHHQGTLDKYTGDGLVSFWGAPVPMRDHADMAIQAGRQMVERIRQWNLQRCQQGKPMARVRIGIESGTALVGDLGTSFRSTYTAVGDCINSASKLQNAAKQYNHDIIVGPEAAKRATQSQLVRIGMIELSGHSRPLPLHTPTDAVLSLPHAALPLTGSPDPHAC